MPHTLHNHTESNPTIQMPVMVIGAGPAGLMAAHTLAQKLGASNPGAGVVHVCDAMPSVGRKLLLAGRGGLNLTHSEPMPLFLQRYEQLDPTIATALGEFDNQAVRDWALGLGVETFVGTSGRVFPTDMKSAPLLRAWLHQMRHPKDGAWPVQIHVRHRWVGFTDEGHWQFETPKGLQTVQSQAVVLALGGASWPQLGSNGAWVPLLEQKNQTIAPLEPSNCGFDVAGGWSEHFATRFAGQPLKSIAISVTQLDGSGFHRKGECMVTQTGLEGSLIYAAGTAIRQKLMHEAIASVSIDLLPHLTLEQVQAHVQVPRGTKSLSQHLKSRLKLDGVKTTLLYETNPNLAQMSSMQLAQLIKGVPILLGKPRPIAEAISTAGGVQAACMHSPAQLQAWPGVFCAGEMLDWDAPTGGYLLTACLATGRHAGLGAWQHLQAAQATLKSHTP